MLCFTMNWRVRHGRVGVDSVGLEHRRHFGKRFSSKPLYATVGSLDASNNAAAAGLSVAKIKDMQGRQVFAMKTRRPDSLFGEIAIASAQRLASWIFCQESKWNLELHLE